MVIQNDLGCPGLVLTANAGYLLMALFEQAAESRVFSAQREVRHNVFAWKSNWIQRDTSCSLPLLPTFPRSFDVLN